MVLYKLLDKIGSPSDLRMLPLTQLKEICTELRAFIIESVIESGGHFSANLGTVELTVALHYVFDTPKDQLIWDVGHQAYGHKILTGRKKEFHSIRKKDGLSGFPKISESDYDTFGTGHSSTSISAMLGMAEADLLLNYQRQHIAVIGDGSLTGGMAWEALNNAAMSKTNLLVIINDNHIGIDPNTGALNNYLENLKSGEPNFFTELGFKYFGADDGHDVIKLVDRANQLKDINGPKIWHIKTLKGKGHAAAELEQTKWHAVKYVKISEEPVKVTGEKFQDVFGLTLLDLANRNPKIIGVTPAMPSGSSMNIMMKEMPHRTFDVGIAEQHAVTFSAGMTLNGMVVFCNIYSTFIQRAYDQIIHDVCLQNIPVIFCLDRAGVAGEDGATHHGLFDIAFLRCIPNMIVAAPSNELELRQLMYTASVGLNNPIAIRYPKGNGNLEDWRQPFDILPIGKANPVKRGEKIAFLCLGAFLQNVMEAVQLVDSKWISVVDMRFAKPLDEDTLHQIFKSHQYIFTIEDGCVLGGFGSSIAEFAAKNNYHNNMRMLGFPDKIIPHATREELIEMYQLDAKSILRMIEEVLLQ